MKTTNKKIMLIYDKISSLHTDMEDVLNFFSNYCNEENEQLIEKVREMSRKNKEGMTNILKLIALKENGLAE